jgi:hypothetical protein
MAKYRESLVCFFLGHKYAPYVANSWELRCERKNCSFYYYMPKVTIHG